MYQFELASLGWPLPSTRNGIINLHMTLGWYLMVLSFVMIAARFLVVILRLPYLRYSLKTAAVTSNTPVTTTSTSASESAAAGASGNAVRPPSFVLFLLRWHWLLLPILFCAQYATMMYSRPLAHYTGIDRLAIKGAHKPLALTTLAVNILMVGYRQYAGAVAELVERERERRRQQKDD